MTIRASRYHDISCGHRVVGHEGKCRYLHGHNYRIHFICEAGNGARANQLDTVGRVIDFSEIKSRLCMWLEEHWDHRLLLWQDDPWLMRLATIDDTVVIVPFNPTAENLANYLLTVIGPDQLYGTGVELVRVVVEETAKCSAEADLW